MNLQTFLKGRIDLVKTLCESSFPVTYPDCVLILTAVMSACAACRWPGKRFDQKRFVQSLIQFGSPKLNLDYVSTGALLEMDLISLKESPWGARGNALNIFTGEQIDGPIQTMANRYTRVTVSEFKRASYANQIYNSLRCGYAHTYLPGGYTTDYQVSDFPAQISYMRCTEPDGKVIMESHFHFDYLIDVAQQQVSTLLKGNLNKPAQWWLDQT